MLPTEDELYGYGAALLGVAPLATQLAASSIGWTLLFPLFAIPACSLLLSIGHLSNAGPALTYKRIAPIASGIGFALAVQVAQHLFAESLTAAQTLLYILFSIRTELTWATQCGHVYNTQNYCHDFNDLNVSVPGPYSQYPNNFWPSQEFNRYLIRRNPIPEHIPATWEPNEWYLGPSKDEFYFAFPSLPLVAAHIIIWGSIYMLVTKYSDWLSYIVIRVCILFPIALYIVLILGMTFCGFKFGKSIQVEVEEKKINEDPIDFWSDVRGLYRTSLLLIDYSGAFTGLLIFATSRLRSGAAPMNALMLVPLMTFVPTLLTVMRAGCEGHIASQQPAYKIYSSTEETLAFDMFPVCFATSTFGPLWSILFFTAQLLYNCVGPMIIYLLFIYTTFSEEIPPVQTVPNLFYTVLIATFSIPSLLLYMPYGTKILALVRYTSQSCIISIICYVVLYFIYGWQNIEVDVMTATHTANNPSLLDYFLRPTSPIFTVLLFTLVPSLLMSKFVAVFDLLMYGNDVVKHISAASSFIPGPDVFGLIIGYLIMFSPLLIVTGYASYTLFSMMVQHKLSFADAFQPTSEWMAHSAVNTVRPRPHSLAYGFFNSFIRINYPTALFLLFIAETFLGVLLSCIFMLNTLALNGFTNAATASNYRSVLLLVFLILHIVSLFEIRQSQRDEDKPEKLSLYIGVATMEMATLNGYMWMYSSDHSNSFFDWGPTSLILLNTCIRGLMICTAIAIRANMIENSRPTQLRSASEIYEVDANAVDMDPEDESPIIFDLARA